MFFHTHSCNGLSKEISVTLRANGGDAQKPLTEALSQMFKKAGVTSDFRWDDGYSCGYVHFCCCCVTLFPTLSNARSIWPDVPTWTQLQRDLYAEARARAEAEADEKRTFTSAEEEAAFYRSRARSRDPNL